MTQAGGASTCACRFPGTSGIPIEANAAQQILRQVPLAVGFEGYGFPGFNLALRGERVLGHACIARVHFGRQWQFHQIAPVPHRLSQGESKIVPVVDLFYLSKEVEPLNDYGKAWWKAFARAGLAHYDAAGHWEGDAAE